MVVRDGETNEADPGKESSKGCPSISRLNNYPCFFSCQYLSNLLKLLEFEAFPRRVHWMWQVSGVVWWLPSADNCSVCSNKLVWGCRDGFVVFQNFRQSKKRIKSHGRYAQTIGRPCVARPTSFEKKETRASYLRIRPPTISDKVRKNDRLDRSFKHIC